MKELIILFAILMLSIQADGQSFYTKRYDIGVNATSLISKVISAADDSKDSPIGIYFRRKSDKSGIYLGLAALSSNEDFFENNLSLTVITNNLFGRLGFERYKSLSSKFNVGYGLAVVASTAKEETQESKSIGSTFTQTSSKIHNIDFGGGPVLRFEYKLNNLISLSTESSLIGTLNKKTTTVSTSKGEDVLKTNGYLIATDIPSQLFINIHF
jgi:hypothetical protein